MHLSCRCHYGYDDDEDNNVPSSSPPLLCSSSSTTTMTTATAAASCEHARQHTSHHDDAPRVDLCLTVNGTPALLTPMAASSSSSPLSCRRGSARCRHARSSYSDVENNNDDDDDDGCNDDEYYAVSIDAARATQLAQRYNDYYELRFTLQLQALRNCSSCNCSDDVADKHNGSHRVTSARARPRNLMALLLLPWGTTHYLGPLLLPPPQRPHAQADADVVPSARLVARVPAQARLRVCADVCVPAHASAPWPCEMLLKEHVKTLLDHDEYCGSVASAHVQNLVRDLPFYASAMRRFRNWSDFVRHFSVHYGTWRLVSYTVEQHAQLQLSELTAPDELRLVSNRHTRHYHLGDVQRDRVKLSSLLRLRTLVLRAHAAVTSSRPQQQQQQRVQDNVNESNSNNNKDDSCSTSATSQPFLLTRPMLRPLASSSCFRTLNCVNYLHLLREVAHEHLVLFSPLHPVQVDVRCPAHYSSPSLVLRAHGSGKCRGSSGRSSNNSNNDNTKAAAKAAAASDDSDDGAV